MEKWYELIVEHSNIVKVAARKYLVGAYADWGSNLKLVGKF